MSQETVEIVRVDVSPRTAIPLGSYPGDSG